MKDTHLQILGKRHKVKINKSIILFDAEFAITHKVGHPHVIPAVQIEIGDLFKALNRPVLNILDIKITKGDRIQFDFAKFQEK